MEPTEQEDLYKERVLDIVRPQQHPFPVHLEYPTLSIHDILAGKDKVLLVPFSLWSVVSIALFDAFQRHSLYNVPVRSFRRGHKSTVLALRRLEDICSWHAALEDTLLNHTRVERLLHFGTRRLRVRARERTTVRAIARSIEAYSVRVGPFRARTDSDVDRSHDDARVLHGGVGGHAESHGAFAGDASTDI